jgi:hypothetical protein
MDKRKCLRPINTTGEWHGALCVIVLWGETETGQLPSERIEAI